MSQPEKSLKDFLARWSRRKLVTAESGTAEPASRHAAKGAERESGADAPTSNSAAAKSEAPEQTFDPASLPPIESISAASDIRAFLAPGVPAELARAALRRAWQTDPAIRDFIGIAENQWDFSAPDGVPGFGPLDVARDLQRVAEVLSGRSEGSTSGEAQAGQTPEKSSGLPLHAPALDRPTEASQDAALDAFAGSPASSDIAAPQHSRDSHADRSSAPRAHGGALPK